MPPKTILLDTNFLMIPSQFNVDIFSEIDRICIFPYKIAILDKTLEELENIAQKQRGKHKNAAKLALKLIKSKGLKIVRTNFEKSVDDILAGMASKDIIIATQDIGLKKRLKAKKEPLITLKGRNYLELI